MDAQLRHTYMHAQIHVAMNTLVLCDMIRLLYRLSSSDYHDYQDSHDN